MAKGDHALHFICSYLSFSKCLTTTHLPALLQASKGRCNDAHLLHDTLRVVEVAHGPHNQEDAESSLGEFTEAFDFPLTMLFGMCPSADILLISPWLPVS